MFSIFDRHAAQKALKNMKMRVALAKFVGTEISCLRLKWCLPNHWEA
jgi:hypothetical protein